MIGNNNDNPSLQKQFKDHTVENAVTNLNDLPLNAHSVHLQPVRNMEVTIQVLSEDGESVIETITGKATGGSVKMSSMALIRRTGSLTLTVDPDLFPQQGSLMWFGNIMRVYVGIKDLTQHRDTTINFLLGTFWIDEGSYSIDSDSSSITISMSDKMTKYDDLDLQNPMVIPADTPIHEAIRLVMENLGETSFGTMERLSDNMRVPYDLEFGAGEKAQSVITALRDMYMDCYCGYDIMGNFEFKQLKIQRADDVSEPKWRFDSTASDRADLTVSFNESYNLKNIKNHVVVYGSVSEFTGLTPMGEVRITDVGSPFNVDAIGSRKRVLVESSYATDEQCVAKARYEVWKSSNFQEVATIGSVPIYIFDANDIIEITHPETGMVSRYRIDSFDLGLDVSSEMTINAYKLYYVGLEYGKEMIPIIEDFIKGINNYGWISLAEERIRQCYNIMASGSSVLNVRFVDGELGGEQASVTSYPTTKNQTLRIDIRDFEGLIPNDENGDNGRSTGDYADRVIGHEAFHAVMNDYLGHDVAIQLPEWFKEGMAEYIHGAKERLFYAHSGRTNSEKRNLLTNRAEELLKNGAWVGYSEDYVASYLIAIAIYRICTTSQWKNLFINLRGQSNLSINFLTKLLPIAESNELVIQRLINEIKGMSGVWNMLFNNSDPDTGSVGGIHFMNLYGVPLTADTVFNNADAYTDSLGFQLKFEK